MLLEREECLDGDQAVLDKVKDREGEECEKRCVYVADGDLEHRGGFDSHEADEVERGVDHDAEGDEDDRVAHQFHDRLAPLAEAVVDEAEGDVLAPFARGARAECDGPDESDDGILVGPFELVVEKVAGEDLQAESDEHEQERGDRHVDADCRFHDMYRRGKLLGHCWSPLKTTWFSIGYRSIWDRYPHIKFYMFALYSTYYSAIFLMRSKRSMSQSLMKSFCCR